MLSGSRSMTPVFDDTPCLVSLIRRGLAAARWHLNRQIRPVARHDVHHDLARAAYLTSWQRSGSTWLSEVIASDSRTRFVFEPANLRQVPLITTGGGDRDPLDLAGPDDDLGVLGQILLDALSGRLKDPWTEKFDRTLWATRRIVKDVDTVPVLPWIAAAAPDVPLILLLRHPIATAHSLVDLGWSRRSSDGSFLGDSADEKAEALIAEVARWSEAYSWAIRHDACDKVLILTYEATVRDPRRQLDLIRGHLQHSGQAWANWTPNEARFADPSSTTYRRDQASSAEWIDSWSAHYDDATIERAMAAVADHGLNVVYDRGPEPLLADAAIRDAVRASRHPTRDQPSHKEEL